ncbi:MAG: PAS domain-containing protein, partial [Candidatus Hydrogenedentes bacterium]|nr:PAS domain-containing protein [Candidatus Hydrogenedentota bacterium]
NFMFARDYHSDEVFEMLGFEPLEPYDTFWLFQERMHPDDRRLWEAANTAIQKPGNDLYEVKVRVRHKNGEWRRIWVRGRCLERTDHGAPARMIGTYTDITVQSRHEDWLAGALSALRLSFLAVPIPIAVVSTDWRIAISNNLWRDSASRFGLGGFPNTDGGEPNMAQAADSESDCYRLTAAVQSLFEGQSGNFELLLRGNGPGGQALAEVVAGAIKNDARIVGAVLICRELTGTSAQKQETGPSM